MIWGRYMWGFALESICAFFMFILIFTYESLGELGEIGIIIKAIGIICLFGVLIGLFVPGWEDIAAIAIGLVFSLLIVAIFVPNAFSPYITYNAGYILGGML